MRAGISITTCSIIDIVHTDLLQLHSLGSGERQLKQRTHVLELELRHVAGGGLLEHGHHRQRVLVVRTLRVGLLPRNLGADQDTVHVGAGLVSIHVGVAGVNGHVGAIVFGVAETYRLDCAILARDQLELTLVGTLLAVLQTVTDLTGLIVRIDTDHVAGVPLHRTAVRADRRTRSILAADLCRQHCGIVTYHGFFARVVGLLLGTTRESRACESQAEKK